jgi:hypothetical protein
MALQGVRISNDRNTCLELISRFATKPPTVMQIQQELFEGKSLAETSAASTVSQELAELADVEHQAQRRMVRSSLEMAYTRHLDRRAFNETMEALGTQPEEVRKEAAAQEKAAEDRLATLQIQATHQIQTYQVKLNELRDQLRSLRAGATD